MATYKIAVLPGDGIGQEVTPEAQKVLQVVGKAAGASFEFEHGAGRRRRHRRDGRAAAAKRRCASASRATPSCSGRWADPSGTTCRRSSAPSAGLLALAQGARPLRQPAPGHVLSDARRRLAAQALGGRGHRHHGDPRAHRRALLRRAARARDARRRRRARGQHDGLHVAGDRARGARRLRRRDEAEEAADLGGQGQRARRVAALAGGRHARGEGLSRTSRSTTCWSTTARWPWFTSRRSSTRS